MEGFQDRHREDIAEGCGYEYMQTAFRSISLSKEWSELKVFLESRCILH